MTVPLINKIKEVPTQNFKITLNNLKQNTQSIARY
jgi:hypothetical protein